MPKTRIIMKEFIQKAKSTHPNVEDKVIKEMEALIEVTLGSNEIRVAEIENIADKLINSQIEQNLELSEDHED